MRYTLASFLLLALVGCAAPSAMTQLQADCQSPSFRAYSLCIQGIAQYPGMATDPDAGLVHEYLSNVRLLEKEVAEGRMSDEVAFLRASQHYNRMMQASYNRQAVQGAYAQRRSEYLGAMGLGLMQLGAPRTLGPSPQLPVICTQQGVYTVCQ